MILPKQKKPCSFEMHLTNYFISATALFTSALQLVDISIAINAAQDHSPLLKYMNRIAGEIKAISAADRDEVYALCKSFNEKGEK